MAGAAEVFAELVAQARGVSESATPLPSREAQVEHWRGLAFNVGSTRMLSALGEVSEVLAVPDLTPIPGVRPWVAGVANIRGRLLPVLDLCGYLDLECTTHRSEWRVLVIEDGELFCGLVVEQSFGMMQFEVDDYQQEVGDPLGNALDQYVRGGFRQSGRMWRLMDVTALVRESAFFEVAA